MEIKISCPKCRHNFTLKAQNPSALMSKAFRCPKCGGSTPFSVLLGGGQPGGAMRTGCVPPPVPGSAQPLKTHIGGAPASGVGLGGPVAGGHTQVHQAPSNLSLLVKNSGRSFPLTLGEHILGRDSSDSNATIRLAADPYMSRSHAHLSVSPGIGGISRVTLTGLNSQNAVYVNNGKVYPGSPVELHPGDEILLGMTTVKLISR